MINWFNTHMHDKSSQEIIAFPNKARVSIFQRHTLLKFLKSSYSIEILFQHKTYNYYPIREECDCTNGSPDDLKSTCNDRELMYFVKPHMSFMFINLTSIFHTC